MIRFAGFCKLLLLVWAILAGIPAYAAPATVVSSLPPAILKADEARVNLAGNIAWFKDESGSLTLDEVRARGEFRPLPGGLSAGFTRAAVWLRFDVQSSAEVPSARILEVANALLDDVRFYEPRADGSYTEHRSGEDIPRAQWDIDYHYPSFRLYSDSAKPQRYYLRLWARNAVSAKIQLWQPEAFASATRHEAFNYGIYYGIYSLILIFHLFFWLWTRNRLGGWYLPYVAMNCLVAAIGDGYVQRLTGLTGGTSDLVIGVAICMTMGVSTTFTLIQLELSTVMPRFTRYYQPIIWFTGIVTSLLVLGGNYGGGVGLAQTVMLGAVVLMIAIGIRLALRGHKPAYFFLFAFGFFYAAVLLRFLRNLGFLPPSLLTEYGLPVGALLHMIVMSLGITGQYNQLKREKLAAQAALTQSLEAQVAERTAKLTEEIDRRKTSENETRRALEVEKLASQEQHDFVAMVSHEFRTPLAIINTVTQQLANNLDAPLDKTLQRCTNIRESARRMTDMMDEFLSFDHIGSELRLNRNSCNPCQLISAVADEWEAERLQVTCENLPAGFICDSALLRVALRNLIANAIRHSPDDVPVQLTARGTEEGGIEISVADKGSGIPQDEISRLFQKYFRGRGAQDKPGAGLGLFLVKRIADMHGGTVRVESTLEQGSLFVLTLPGHAAAPSATG